MSQKCFFSFQSNNILKFLSLIDASASNLFWIGLTDRVTEGKFIWNSSQALAGYNSYLNWSPLEPNGGFLENCLVLFTAARKWVDYPCGWEAFALCQKGWSVYDVIELRSFASRRGRLEIGSVVKIVRNWN